MFFFLARFLRALFRPVLRCVAAAWAFCKEIAPFPALAGGLLQPAGSQADARSRRDAWRNVAFRVALRPVLRPVAARLAGRSGRVGRAGGVL